MDEQLKVRESEREREGAGEGDGEGDGEREREREGEWWGPGFDTRFLAGGEEIMAKVAVVCKSIPMYANTCVSSRGVWEFLDLLRLVLTQSGTNVDYTIAITDS